jgi:hypothetical protein
MGCPVDPAERLLPHGCLQKRISQSNISLGDQTGVRVLLCL